MADIPIKSVRRVFEILELFDKKRMPLTAKEIAETLEYPLMSAHELLKSMLHLGYAEYDTVQRAYVPSFAIAGVVDWTRDFLDREKDILDFMTVLNRETRETTNLSRRIYTHVKIIHGLETTQPVGVSVTVGTEMPVFQSLTGFCAMACLELSDFDEFVERFKKVSTEKGKPFDRSLYNGVCEELHEFGSVFRKDIFVEGIGAVCVPVRTKTTGETLVVGVVGPSERIQQHEHKHRKTLKRLAGNFDIDTHWKLKTPPAQSAIFHKV